MQKHVCGSSWAAQGTAHAQGVGSSVSADSNAGMPLHLAMAECNATAQSRKSSSPVLLGLGAPAMAVWRRRGTPF